MAEWVYGVKDFDEYLAKLGGRRLSKLRDDEFLRLKGGNK
jgi:hypothetical protein